MVCVRKGTVIVLSSEFLSRTLTYYFRISKLFVKLLKTHGEIAKKPLKNYATKCKWIWTKHCKLLFILLKFVFDSNNDQLQNFVFENIVFVPRKTLCVIRIFKQVSLSISQWVFNISYNGFQRWNSHL